MPGSFADSFTDVDGTLLEDHVPDSPTAFTWTKHDANALTINGGDVINTTVPSPTQAKYYGDADPLDPNDGIYKVEFLVRMAAVPSTGVGTVIYLVNEPITWDGYSIQFSGGAVGTATLSISRVTNGGHVSLGNTTFSRPPADTEQILALHREGNTLRAYFAGSLVLTVSDSTYADFDYIGVGVRCSSSHDFALVALNGGGDLPPPPVPPVAEFSHSESFLEATFTDESTDSDGSIVAWDWDFGDGSAHSTMQNPIHTYAMAGTYTVTLTVTDDDDLTDDVQHDVTVAEEPPPPPPPECFPDVTTPEVDPAGMICTAVATPDTVVTDCEAGPVGATTEFATPAAATVTVPADPTEMTLDEECIPHGTFGG